MVTVGKFGGEPLKDAKSLVWVVENIIAKDPDLRVIVPSAPAGITNLLTKAAEHRYRGQDGMQEIDEVNGQFKQTAHDIRMALSELQFEELSRAIREDGGYKTEKQYVDAIAPHGERRNARMLAHVMGQAGLKTAIYFPESGLITDGRFGNAKVLPESYAKVGSNIRDLLQQEFRVIVPGFYGVDHRGSFTTFKRGGSDYSEAVIANAIDADLAENYKDVDGVKQADPTVVKNAETIAHMNYDELEEMGMIGSKVIQFDAIAPLIAKGIPLRVRSVRHLDRKGTLIDGNGSKGYAGITGISHRDNCYRLSLFRRGISNVRGYGAAFYNELSEHGVSYAYTADASNTIEVLLHSVRQDKVEEVREALLTNPTLSPDSVTVQSGKTIIGVVAQGLEMQPGVGYALMGILKQDDVNIERLAQGGPHSIYFVVDGKNGHQAVRALYQGLREQDAFKKY